MPMINQGVLALLGIGVLGGLLGAWLSQKLRFPQVVGYIVIGLLLGETGLKIISLRDVEQLLPFNQFALGIIGFLVGGELRIDTFRKYARQFLAILLGEGLAAFLLVGIGAGLLVYAVVGDPAAAVAAGVVFGAIASATDPASTISVLWEMRARGVLSTTITAIVALDDALAMTLYGIGTGLAQLLTNHSGSIVHEMGKVAGELGGAICLGAAFALLLRFLLRYLHEPDRALGLAIAVILLVISFCAALNLDVILAAMTVGFVLVNSAPHRSKNVFKVLHGVALPIYTMFFVLVGARLSLGNMPHWLWGAVAIYVVGRNVGKMAGAWVGGRITGAEPTVRRYLGLGLFAQGGFAVGLSIMAADHLGSVDLGHGLLLGDAIIFAVTATTLIMQLTGPPMVKWAVLLAGENDLDVTDDDVVREWTVADVMQAQVTTLPEAMPLPRALETIAASEAQVYPVTDEDGRLAGTLSMTALKAVLADRDTWNWLVIADVLEPTASALRADQPLQKALHTLDQTHMDQIPVTAPDSDIVTGLFDLARARKAIAAEVLRRRQAKQ